MGETGPSANPFEPPTAAVEPEGEIADSSYRVRGVGLLLELLPGQVSEKRANRGWLLIRRAYRKMEIDVLSC